MCCTQEVVAVVVKKLQERGLREFTDTEVLAARVMS